MDRELQGALADLGLSPAEADIYVALVADGGAGPISAYRLAQTMGRDPANLSKMLAAMVRRGAVRAAGRRPRLYAAVAPQDFTDRLIARLQDRQQVALRLLADIGRPAPDHDLQPLGSAAEVAAAAARLVGGARRRVLAGGTGAWLDGLVEALAAAAARGAAIEIATDRRPGRPADGGTPGPWLLLAVDDEASLEAVGDPAGGEALVCGHWSTNPGRAYLVHRSLASEPDRAAAHPAAASRTVTAAAAGEAAADDEAAAAGEADEPLRFVHRRRRS